MIQHGSVCSRRAASALRRRVGVLVLVVIGLPRVVLGGAHRVAAEIRTEALRLGPDPQGGGYPLPLAAHWNTGCQGTGGFSPAYQLQLLEAGRRILPWLAWPPGEGLPEECLIAGVEGVDARRKRLRQYYDVPLRRFAELRLPISLISTQWERVLSEDEAYRTREPSENPNVVTRLGVLAKVSPFGPAAAWSEVGKRWTRTAAMRNLQRSYPDPPLVLLVSNNEHPKLAWHEVEEDVRYVARFGDCRADDFKRKIVAEGWRERYGALRSGIVEGLVASTWRSGARLVGYGAIGPAVFGRTPRWRRYSLYGEGVIDPSPQMWDGASLPYYIDDWRHMSDSTAYSPQVEAMNWVFMINEARRIRPAYWLEMSTWNGAVHGSAAPGATGSGRAEVSPERYEGFVQFGMWLLRPRVVREFRGWRETVEATGEYFDAVLRAVDRVYENPILRRFWREGRLVANRTGAHPYGFNIPAEYAQVDRWFLLDTDAEEKRPWYGRASDLTGAEGKHAIPVFALALVLATEPHREWLVYANSPAGRRTGVGIVLPDFGKVTATATPAGCFFQVVESTRTTVPVAGESCGAG